VWGSGRAIRVTDSNFVPAYDHIVVVVEENHSYDEIIGSSQAPYINSLARSGALLSSYRAVAHPSEPNYFALYAGSTFGVVDNGTHQEPDPTLGSILAANERRFVGYVESGSPARHNPWESFPEGFSVEQNVSAFPSDFSGLPAVSFVVPNLADDMHDGSIGRGDAWLQSHIDAYAHWAVAHNSLLIITFDEDDSSQANRVPTILLGAHIATGVNATPGNHYDLLHTILQASGLPAPNIAANASGLDSAIFLHDPPQITDAARANDLNRTSSASGFNHFIDYLNFEASYTDLVRAFGMNQQAMQDWYSRYEPTERRVETFDGLDYIASYGDLINAFRSVGSMHDVQDAGASHYITYGSTEGRTTTFNGLDYIASYGDLIAAYGANNDAGAFITSSTAITSIAPRRLTASTTSQATAISFEPTAPTNRRARLISSTGDSTRVARPLSTGYPTSPNIPILCTRSARTTMRVPRTTLRMATTRDAPPRLTSGVT
jgi:hypothetical protein